MSAIERLSVSAKTRLISRVRDPEREASLSSPMIESMRPLAGYGQNCDLWMVVPQARWNLTTIKSQGASGQLMVGEPVFHLPSAAN
jgi:hypothetical protein